ncbi:MAG: hypothetical protein GF346_12410 [Candidatus Eisenbacteria bacterium]|nr:hypothetical protein [Candidatus Latescibacterota bacterium]MBD3303239.1 hypothetical protein [Candidatus Eisenbacteria bacterium]
MIRLVLVSLLWVVIIGGLWLFTGSERTGFDDSMATTAPLERTAPARIVLELTPTFDLAPDPFALESSEPALLVRLNGREIYRADETIPAGRPIVIDRELPLLEGPNELFLRATPPLGAGNRSHALRARLLWRNRTLIERTAWSEPGAPLVAAFPFEIEEEATREPDHDH